MDALAEMLAAWRKRPHPALHDLIVRASQELASPAPTQLRGKKGVDAWQSAAIDPAPLEVPWLLETLIEAGSSHAATRAHRLASVELDPRIDEAVVRTIETVPFYGEASKTFWKCIFVLAARIRDRRLVDRIENAEVPAFFRGEASRWFANRKTEIVESLREALEPDGPAPDLAKWSAVIDTAKKHHAAAPARNVDELLAAVYANPDDDAVRLVYADAVGGERGELIVLQCGPADAKTAKRAAALVKKHGKEWLGSLAGVVMKHFVFERGFLARCRVGKDMRGRIMQVVGNSAWSTVRAFAGSPAVALHPTMRALRELEYAEYLAKAEDNLEGWRDLLVDTERPIERLTFRPRDQPPHELTEALSTCNALPGLKSLVIEWSPAVFDKVLSGPIAARLESVGLVDHLGGFFYSGGNAWLGDVLARMQAPTFQLAMHSFGSTCFTFHRDKRGFHALDLDVPSSRTDTYIGEVENVIAESPKTIETVRLRLEPQMAAHLKRRVLAAIESRFGVKPVSIEDSIEPLPNQVHAGISL